MNYTYRLHEKVQVDFDEGFAWYEERRRGLGYEYFDAIEDTINKIAVHPDAFGSRGNLNYREALLKRFPYVIVYKIYEKKKEIFISSIHHTKKSPQKKYRRP